MNRTNDDARTLSLREAFHTRGVLSVSVIAVGVVAASLIYRFGFTSLVSNTKPVGGAVAQKQTKETNTPAPAPTEGDTPEQKSTPPTRAELENTFTKTELLAGDVLGTYIDRKKANVYSTDDNNAIISRALEGLAPQPTKVYTKEMLTRVPEGEAAATTYRQAMTRALAPITSLREYELQTYARASETNDPKAFAAVRAEGDVYAGITTALEKTQVPEGAVYAHLALMNAFAKVAASLRMMSRGYDDIAGSYAAVGTFGAAEKELDYAYTLHEAYLAAHNAL